MVIAMSDNNPNLSLWNEVFVTDTKFTKEAQKGQHRFTSISPMYQKYKMTAAVGAQGIAWGVEIGSESFEYKEIGTTTLLIYKAILFYEWEGRTGRLPIGATEKIAYITKSGEGYLKIDDEADKKVRTSAMTKGLSELGVSADIFMNLHMDQEYQEYASAKLRVDSGNEEEIQAAKDEFKEWFNKELKNLGLAPSIHALNLMCESFYGKARDKMIILKVSKQDINLTLEKINKRSAQVAEEINNKQAD